jgi:putative OPT family oligopeptide transporter
VPGDLEEVAGTVFSQQVRFVGAGAMAVAAVWSLLRTAGAMAKGLSGIAAAARARRAGKTLELGERDLPGGVVIGGSLALMLPVLALVWHFNSGGPLAEDASITLPLTLLYLVVIGVITAVVTGYMAGLVGTSNSPVSGVGILAVLAAAVLVAMIPASGADRAPYIAFSLFMTSFVFGVGIVANDNLQDLKTGQLVGSTPWKQQVALVIGVLAGSIVLPPVLQLLHTTFGFAGAPGAGPDALAAPQASLFSAIAQGVLGGSFRWDLFGTGLGIGAALVVLDEVLGRAGKIRLPPLAVGMGIYLPAQLMIPTVIGAIIGWAWNRMAARTSRPEFAERMGVQLATGLVVGDSLFGLVFAGAVGALGDPNKLAIVGADFAPTAQFLALPLGAILLGRGYSRTRAKVQ